MKSPCKKVAVISRIVGHDASTTTGINILNLFLDALLWPRTSNWFIMERSSHAGNVTTKQLQRVVSINTNKQYMKERSTHAENVNTKQLERVVLRNTSKQYMRERSLHAGNLTPRQSKRVVWLNTSKAYMKEIITYVRNVANFRSRLKTHQDKYHQSRTV